MSRNSTFGTKRELQAAQIGSALGYLVSSLRRTGGGGDQLWTPSERVRFDLSLPPPIYIAPILLEVKGTKHEPWHSSSFGPERRRELIETAERYGCEPLLCWWPPNHGPFWVPPDEWPVTLTGGPDVYSLSGNAH
jgi:hypothetical protein